MDATRRIVEEFDRLVGLGRNQMPDQLYASRAVYYIVAARCDIDIGGFAAIYEQSFSQAEFGILIDGLRRIGEESLADAFATGLRLLEQDGYYAHEDWNKVSKSVKNEINQLYKRVGNHLWDLDEKLAALLDGLPGSSQ
jgi:hypothetical protein